MSAKLSSQTTSTAKHSKCIEHTTPKWYFGKREMCMCNFKDNWLQPLYWHKLTSTSLNIKCWMTVNTFTILSDVHKKCKFCTTLTHAVGVCSPSSLSSALAPHAMFFCCCYCCFSYFTYHDSMRFAFVIRKWFLFSCAVCWLVVLLNGPCHTV